MILESARVENFKCIDDSTEFSIRSLTALVGKNESGKTALLKALYRDQPDPAGRRQLPRHRVPAAPVGGLPAAHGVGARPRRHRHVAPRGARPRVVADAARAPTPSPGRTVVVTRGYDNRLALADRHRRAARRLEPGAQRQARRRRTAQPVGRHERRRTRPDAPGARIAHAGPDGAAADVEERFSGGPLAEQVAAMLEKRLPRFLYFAEYHRLPGEVAIDELMRRKAANELTVVDTIFLALLELANTSPEDLQRHRPVRVPRRRARVGVAAHHARRDGVLEPGPLARGRLPLRRRAAARPAAVQHRLHPAHAHPEPAAQRSRSASTSAAPASSGSSRSSSGSPTSGATRAPTTSSCSTSRASACTPARRWT